MKPLIEPIQNPHLGSFVLGDQGCTQADRAGSDHEDSIPFSDSSPFACMKPDAKGFDQGTVGRVGVGRKRVEVLERERNPFSHPAIRLNPENAEGLATIIPSNPTGITNSAGEERFHHNGYAGRKSTL
jgi:hypothetical protein